MGAEQPSAAPLPFNVMEPAALCALVKSTFTTPHVVARLHRDHADGIAANAPAFGHDLSFATVCFICIRTMSSGGETTRCSCGGRRERSQ